MWFSQYVRLCKLTTDQNVISYDKIGGEKFSISL